jgi:hypothetical protein
MVMRVFVAGGARGFGAAVGAVAGGAGGPVENGVPTSYYAAVEFACRAEIIDNPQAKAELLCRQLAHFQPERDRAAVTVDGPPYGRVLPGLRLRVTSVARNSSETTTTRSRTAPGWRKG